MKSFFELWGKWSNDGLRWPFIHDPRSKKPSITLLFTYITFVLAFSSVIALHFWPSLIVATPTSIFFWVISVIFYRLRNLDKAKFDLDDRMIELEGSGDDDEQDS